MPKQQTSYSLYRIFAKAYIRFSICVEFHHEPCYQSAFRVRCQLSPLLLAEALLRHTDPRFEAFSAGSEPSEVDPRTTQALEAVGVDATGLRSKSISEFQADRFDYVITLCDKSASECLPMPNAGEIIAWDFPDPVTSDDPGAFRHTLHDIHERIKLFVLVKTKHLEDL
jgi:protein-tyrosine-phosphatase